MICSSFLGINLMPNNFEKCISWLHALHAGMACINLHLKAHDPSSVALTCPPKLSKSSNQQHTLCGGFKFKHA